MGIPRPLRDFQARWKSLLLDFSTERLFHSLCRQRFAFHIARSPIIRIYDWSSVRYLVAMFRFSANHSALADGIMSSCWRSFCGVHLNDQLTHTAMTSETASNLRQAMLLRVWQKSQCEDAALGHRGGPGRITNTPRIRSSSWNGRRGRTPVN